MLDRVSHIVRVAPQYVVAIEPITGDTDAARALRFEDASDADALMQAPSKQVAESIIRQARSSGWRVHCAHPRREFNRFLLDRGDLEAIGCVVAMSLEGIWPKKVAHCAMSALSDVQASYHASTDQKKRLGLNITAEDVMHKARSVGNLHDRIREKRTLIDGIPVDDVHYLDPMTLALWSETDGWAVIRTEGVAESEDIVRAVDSHWASIQIDDDPKWVQPHGTYDRQAAYERAVGLGVFAEMDDFVLADLEPFDDPAVAAICRSGVRNEGIQSTPHSRPNPFLESVRQNIHLEMDRKFIEALSSPPQTFDDSNKDMLMETFDGHDVAEYLFIDAHTLVMVDTDDHARVYHFNEPVSRSGLTDRGLSAYDYVSASEPVDEMLDQRFWWQHEEAPPPFTDAERAAIGRALGTMSGREGYEKEILADLEPYELDAMDLGQGRMDQIEALAEAFEHLVVRKKKQGGTIRCEFHAPMSVLIDGDEAWEVDVVESYDSNLHLVRQYDTDLYAGVIGHRNSRGNLYDPTLVGDWVQMLDEGQLVTCDFDHKLSYDNMLTLFEQEANTFAFSLATGKPAQLRVAKAYLTAQNHYSIVRDDQVEIDGDEVRMKHVGKMCIKISDERIWIDSISMNGVSRSPRKCLEHIAFDRAKVDGVWEEGVYAQGLQAMCEGMAIVLGTSKLSQVSEILGMHERDDIAHYMLEHVEVSRSGLTLKIDGRPFSIGHAAKIETYGYTALITTHDRTYTLELGRPYSVEELANYLKDGTYINAEMLYDPVPHDFRASHSSDLTSRAHEMLHKFEAPFDAIKKVVSAHQWDRTIERRERSIVSDHLHHRGQLDAVYYARTARSFMDLQDSLEEMAKHDDVLDRYSQERAYEDRYKAPTWERIGRLADALEYADLRKQFAATVAREWPETMYPLETRVLELGRESTLKRLYSDELDWRRGVTMLNVHAGWVSPQVMEQIGVDAFVEDEKEGREFVSEAQRVALHTLFDVEGQRREIWKSLDEQTLEPHEIARVAFLADDTALWDYLYNRTYVTIDYSSGVDLNTLASLCELFDLDTQTIQDVGQWMLFYQLGDPDMNQHDIRTELTHYAKDAPEDFELPEGIDLDKIVVGSSIDVRESAHAILNLHRHEGLSVDAAQAVVAKYVLERMSDDEEAVSPANEGVVKAAKKLKPMDPINEASVMSEENLKQEAKVGYANESKQSYVDKAKEITKASLMAGSIDDISGAALDSMRELLGNDYVDAVLGNENGKDMTRVLMGHAAMFVAMNHPGMVPHPKLIEAMSASMAGHSTAKLMSRNQKVFREMFMSMITAAEDSFGSVEEAKQAFGVLEAAEDTDEETVFAEQPETVNANG